MGLKVRTDIFEDFAITVNTENIHKKSETIDSPLNGIKDDSVTSNNEVKLFGKRKKDTEQLEIKWKGSNQNENKEKVEPEQRSENGMDKITDIEEWFNARRILLGLKITGTKKQKVDALEEDKSENQKETSNNSTSTINKVKTIESTNLKSIKFSNHTKDSVQTVCQICKNAMSFTNMRSHTKSVHKTSITDYKKKHGQLIDHIVDLVYHKCGICDKAILLDGDNIAPHAKSHGMSHRVYSAKYMTLNKGTTNTKEAKKTIKPITFDEESIKGKSATELLAELEEMIATI